MKSFATRSVAVAAVGIAAGMALLASSAAQGAGPQWTAEPSPAPMQPVRARIAENEPQAVTPIPDIPNRPEKEEPTREAPIAQLERSSERR